MRQLLAALLTASALNAQELSPKEVETFLSRLSESRGGAAMQANFREERRLALMNKPVIETEPFPFFLPISFAGRWMEGA
jgi:hypothetical protein